jgi:uncharacterized membrane protein YfcA
MNLTSLALLVGVGSLAAGLLGSLTGLGGGIIVVPMLTLLFHIDMRYAIGASLIAVIATSSGAATAYVREGYTNVRIAILLEIATTVGALTGALLSGYASPAKLSILFGVVLIATALRSLRPRAEHAILTTPDRWSTFFRLDSSYPTPNGPQHYSAQRIPLGFSLMFVGGVLSALLGIGAGIIKVLAMDQVMSLPFKVSTTTSNFMIGVTAAVSAAVYLHRGQIDPAISFPVMLGAGGGALLGARILTRADVRWLRPLFTVIVFVAAVEMLYKGITGTI